MEIFINRPIRLKKFDPVGGTRNEIRSTRNQFSGFVRLAIVMHPYEYSTAGGGPFMKRCSRRNAHFDRRERSLSSAYLRVSPKKCPEKSIRFHRSYLISFPFFLFSKVATSTRDRGAREKFAYTFFRDLAFEVERNPIHATRNSIRHELALSCARISRAPR